MKKNIDEQVQQALQDLGMDSVDWQRRISASDVLYLLDQCPFLQIMDTGLQMTSELPPLQLITAKSGWKIHDYGNAMSSSPGESIYGKPRLRRTRLDQGEDKGGEGGEGGSGVGTLVNQAVITAVEMVEIAQQHGWAGVQLIDGHPLMAWAAWMQTLDSGMELEGYEPTAKDYAKLRRVKGASADRGPIPKLSR
jgi:hypothetical protein